MTTDKIVIFEEAPILKGARKLNLNQKLEKRRKKYTNKADFLPICVSILRNFLV
jgi:hypothetical protein